MRYLPPALAVAVGLVVRLLQLHHLAGTDILTGIDGYYYLNLARSGDWHSGLPAMLALAPGGMLEAGFWLPVALGPLLAIPTYLWGRELTNRWGGFVAASIAVVAPVYLARTGAGRPDTDLLNATFVMGLAWLCYRQRLLAATALWFLFVWWWDLAPLPATLAYLAPLTLVTLQRGWQLDLRPFYLWLFVATITLCLLIDTHASQIIYALHSKPDRGYPPMNVAEMFAPNPAIWLHIGGHWAVSVVAAVGLALAGLQWRKVLYLGVPVGLSLLAIGSNRFLLFVSPLLGLGVAIALWHATYWGRWPSRLAGAMAIASCLTVGVPVTVPRVPEQIEAFEWLQNTPEDSVILSDWGHGHLIRWYGQRQPYDDGRIHGAKKLYMASVPMAMDDSTESAHWIKDKLGASYIIVDRQKFHTGWWCYGTWNLNTHTCRRPGDWIKDTTEYRLLTQPSVPGFGLVFDNGFARVWKIL